MFWLYEGSMRTTTRSSSVLGVLDAIEDMCADAEEVFEAGNLYVYRGHEWAEMVAFMATSQIPEESAAEAAESGAAWFAATGMPKEINEDQAVVNMQGPAVDDYREATPADIYHLFSIPLDLTEANDMLREAFPDHGFRIVKA